MKKRNIFIIYILIGICLFGTAALLGCGSSTDVAKDGDTVQVNYTLTLSDGTLYETSVGKEPLELVLGNGNYLPDFEAAIKGMKVGESNTVTIPAADAYGAYNDDLVFIVDRSQLEEGMDPKVGDQLQGKDASGRTTLYPSAR